MNAIQYNISQNYDADTIKKIQRTIGATADGSWGHRTVARMQAWQKAHGISPDGKCGPGTLSRISQEWEKDNQPNEEEEALDDKADDAEALHDDDDDDDDGDHDVATHIGDGFHYFDGDQDIDASSSGDAVVALLNDLFAFGFTDSAPSSRCGQKGAEAIAAFQRAAATPHRVCNSQCARIEVPVTFKLQKEGVVDAATRAEIRLWKEKAYRWQEPGKDFIERRVRVNKLGGNLSGSSILLADVPGTGGKPRKLHRLAAASFMRMSEACKQDIGVELLVQSGWRRHRWQSREQYEKVLIQKYGSVKKGKAYLGYASAHETGLAVDIGSGGLEAKSATIAKQKKTPVYQWLIANAYRFGFYPYKVEPWHWEFPLSVRAWTTGLSDWRLSDEA